MSTTPPPVYSVHRFGYENLRPAIRTGSLRRIRPGAYLPDPDVDDPWSRRRELALARCVAVAEKLTCRFVFSHASAALLRGWPVDLRDGRVHVTQVVTPGAGGPADLVRHVRTVLPPTVLVHGLPVTDPHRTLLDCARFLDPCTALAVCDGGFREIADVDVFARPSSSARQEVLRAELFGSLADVRPRARGVARARAVVGAATGFSQSSGESWLRWLGLVAGLPEPVVQWELVVGGQLFFSDLGWDLATPAGPHRVAAEYDGAVKYGEGGRDALIREKSREDRIRDLGIRVIRFSAEHMREPGVAAQRLVAAFPHSVRATLQPRTALARRPRLPPRTRGSAATA